jgi:hypothetical protein
VDQQNRKPIAMLFFEAMIITAFMLVIWGIGMYVMYLLSPEFFHFAKYWMLLGAVARGFHIHLTLDQPRKKAT